MRDLLSIARDLAGSDDAPLPVDQWHPERCGEMDLVIQADGAWVHEGAPITRAPLIRLFSRVLRRDETEDGDEYVLVTPAERIAIRVEDAPFLVTDYDRDETGITVRTNVGDTARLGADHPLVMRESPALGLRLPYVRIRGGLDARFDRAPYYRLVDEAERVGDRLVLRSEGEVFDLGAAPDGPDA